MWHDEATRLIKDASAQAEDTIRAPNASEWVLTVHRNVGGDYAQEPPSLLGGYAPTRHKATPDGKTGSRRAGSLGRGLLRRCWHDLALYC